MKIVRNLALILAMAAVTYGCTASPTESVPSRVTVPTPVSQPSADKSAEPSAESAPVNPAPADPAPSPAEQSEPSPGRFAATVVDVVDGDTIKVRFDGRVETIRMLLVDTPETVHPDKPVQPFGPEASQFTKSLLEGKTVELEKDVSERDKYGRFLAYVYVGGQSVQEMLLERGLARVAYVYVPNIKYVDQYRAIQAAAQAARVGIWSIEGYGQGDEPAPPTTPAPTNPTYNPNGPDRDCPDFATRAEAQAFFLAAGGPGADPHKLDSDGDGLACETLP